MEHIYNASRSFSALLSTGELSTDTPTLTHLGYLQSLPEVPATTLPLSSKSVAFSILGYGYDTGPCPSGVSYFDSSTFSLPQGEELISNAVQQNSARSY